MGSTCYTPHSNCTNSNLEEMYFIVLCIIRPDICRYHATAQSSADPDSFDIQTKSSLAGGLSHAFNKISQIGNGNIIKNYSDTWYIIIHIPDGTCKEEMETYD
jgi:hypothetical protein